jgi:doubled CXXCH motif protein/cytochrome c554/c'-like protein
MTLQWIVVSLFLAGALLSLGRSLRSGGAWICLALAYGGLLTSAGWWQHQVQQEDNARTQLATKVPGPGGAAGYTTSDTCRSCHPDQYNSWHRSFHRTMTQLPTRQNVRGNFENVSLELEGQKFHLQRRGDEFWVDMVDPDWNYVRTLRRAASEQGRGSPPPDEPNPPRRLKRISMMTGSHHMQAYWTASDFGNMLFSFPFTFFFEEDRWVPRNAVFLIDPAMRFDPQVWNVNCINCHATVGQPRQDRQTRIISSTAVELGIACEACHGPAENHVRLNQDPTRRYGLHRRGAGDPSIFNPGRADHVKASEACGQCHAIRRPANREAWNDAGIGFQPGGDLEARYPAVVHDLSDLDQPGREAKRAVLDGSFWRDGQVRVSGREFLGLAGSACYRRGSLTCTSCHSLHRYVDTDDQLAASMEGNEACLQCHGPMRTRLAEHTHHSPASTGSVCYNCHMPHTTYGLVKAIRSHLIDSPAVNASLRTGRPNACNLCHLDRSLDWTARQLHAWYGQPLVPVSAEYQSTSAAVIWLLTGDAGQRALIAWHMGWAPARSTSGHAWLAPYLAELLVDPYATVRCMAQRSLKRLPGYEDFQYDYIAPLAERAAGRERALERWRRRGGISSPAAGANAVLLRGDGSRQEERVAALLRQRDDHRMELLE